MTGSQQTSERPALDLTICDREPIHIPGAIQPYGAVLAARIDDLVVTQASANLAAILGTEAKSALGQPLQQAIGTAACRAIASATEQHGHSDSLVISGGTSVHLHAYRSGPLICVDIEPMRDDREELPGVMAQSVLETFQRATNPFELCDLAVRGLKALTRYDRVMAYRFGEDGHGEVIAEAREEHLQSYFGLRYPASDIPQQARRQYLLQRVGVIADSSYTPVPMLTHPTLQAPR